MGNDPGQVPVVHGDHRVRLPSVDEPSRPSPSPSSGSAANYTMLGSSNLPNLATTGQEPTAMSTAGFSRPPVR